MPKRKVQVRGAGMEPEAAAPPIHMAVVAKKGSVTLRFSQPITFFEMTRDQALEVAQSLRRSSVKAM